MPKENIEDQVDKYLDLIPEALPIEEKYELYKNKFSSTESIQMFLDYISARKKHYHLLDELADLLENGSGFSVAFDEFLENFNMM
jgi:hypothetical protein